MLFKKKYARGGLISGPRSNSKYADRTLIDEKLQRIIELSKINDKLHQVIIQTEHTLDSNHDKIKELEHQVIQLAIKKGVLSEVGIMRILKTIKEDK